jgi:hypothetical protein
MGNMAEDMESGAGSESDPASSQEVNEQDTIERGSTLVAANNYAARGWKVFPVRGKIPLVQWQQEATLDRTKILEWWGEKWPDAGVAVVTGNGLVVLDVDAGHGGLDTLGTLFAGYPDLGDTPVVRTGGGGLHFYFSTTVELRNKTGVLTGIDVRGDGGYVVAPPSPHASGKNYEWEVESDTLFPWPFDYRFHKAEPAPTIVEGEGIPAGNRNSMLTSLAGSMRRRGMGELAIRMALLTENEEQCKPPLPESEIKHIAKSIMRYTPEDPATSIELETMAVTAKQFLEEVVDEPEWLVDRLWGAGSIGFVLGPPKVFKSFFTLEMAYALANGKPFLGLFKVPEPRTVLLIQEESGRAAFKERMRRASIAYGNSENLFVISNKPFNLEAAAGYERLKMEVAKLRPAMLILDPLSSFVRGDQNSAQNMGDFVRSLIDLRNEFNMAIVIVHHSKKTNAKDFRGSSALYASSEVTIRLVRPDDAISRSKVSFELKDGESPASMEVQFQQATGTLAPITQSQLLAMAMSTKAAVHRSDYNNSGEGKE